MMERANKKAQTAMELAVFGSILIFVVGVIVRQALNAGYQQNQFLKAMRQAMSTSYRYSAGLTGLGGNDGTASHQTASILFVEDRLTADSAKYAAIDRTPFIVSASATYSRNMLLPVEWYEDFNLPIFDVFINGKHFPFTTARFKTVELARPCRLVPNTASCPAECNGDCSAASVQLYPAPQIHPGGPSGYPAGGLPPRWEPNCLRQTGECGPGAMCVTTGCTTCCVLANGDCDPPPPPPAPPPPPVTFERRIGCAKLYTVVFNHPGFPQWCDGSPASSCPPNNLTANDRFDLDRDGTTDVPAAERPTFSWQWYEVVGYDEGFKFPSRVAFNSPPPPPPPVNTLLRGEGIKLPHVECKKDCDSKNVSIDVDGDLKREKLMPDSDLPSKVVDPKTGVLLSVVVMDQQDGDQDFTRGDSDTGPKPGLTKDMRMYSDVRDGTYFLVEEGRLYAPGGDASQYIRTAQKKDQIDVVERAIQLSNDTGRFCDSGGNPVPPGSIWTEAVPNPVEVCGDDPGECWTGANIKLTCMDQLNRLIWVRSRVVDARGRKWITNTSSDAPVDFVVPAVP